MVKPCSPHPVSRMRLHLPVRVPVHDAPLVRGSAGAWEPLMRKTPLATSFLAALPVAGCTMSEQRAGGGAVVGAGTGALIGAMATGRPSGALAGAAVGGATGAIVGAATTPAYPPPPPPPVYVEEVD